MTQTKKKIYLAAGFISFGLGIIGLLLPIMPTAPFIILAAFFFSRGSKKWHQWLITHPRWGSLIIDWETHRVIRKKHKILSTVLISGSVISVTVFAPYLWLKLSCYAIFVCALLFIWTRNSEPTPPL